MFPVMDQMYAEEDMREFEAIQERERMIAEAGERRRQEEISMTEGRSYPKALEQFEGKEGQAEEPGKGGGMKKEDSRNGKQNFG